MSQSKDFVKTAQTILKDQGHEIPLGHVYELFARLGGYNDWNTAKADGAEFIVTEKGFVEKLGQGYFLNPNEMEIVTNIADEMEEHDKRLRDCKIVRITGQGNVWCKFDADYVLRSGIEPTPEVIERMKDQFFKDLEEWESKAPIDRDHIDVEMVTAQGYTDDISREDLDVDIELMADRQDHKLGVGPTMFPDLTEYQKIAEGARIRQAKLLAGRIRFPVHEKD